MLRCVLRCSRMFEYAVLLVLARLALKQNLKVLKEVYLLIWLYGFAVSSVYLFVGRGF
jgi:hypothetical protein